MAQRLVFAVVPTAAAVTAALLLNPRPSAVALDAVAVDARARYGPGLGGTHYGAGAAMFAQNATIRVNNTRAYVAAALEACSVVCTKLAMLDCTIECADGVVLPGAPRQPARATAAAAWLLALSPAVRKARAWAEGGWRTPPDYVRFQMADDMEMRLLLRAGDGDTALVRAFTRTRNPSNPRAAWYTLEEVDVRSFDELLRRPQGTCATLTPSSAALWPCDGGRDTMLRTWGLEWRWRDGARAELAYEVELVDDSLVAWYA